MLKEVLLSIDSFLTVAELSRWARTCRPLLLQCWDILSVEIEVCKQESFRAHQEWEVFEHWCDSEDGFRHRLVSSDSDTPWTD